MLLIHLEHSVKTGNAASSKRLHGACTDAIDTDTAGTAQIISQITGAGFQGSFGNSHQIVVRNHFFGSQIGHRQNAAVVGHHGFHGAGKSYQGISGDIQGNLERLAARFQETAAKSLLRGKSHGMQQTIYFIRMLADPFKESVNRFITADIQIINGNILAEVLMDQLENSVLETFSLIIEDELCARFMPRLGNCERDAALVRYADYDTNFAFE